MSSSKSRSRISKESLSKSPHHPVFLRAGEGIKILGPKQYTDVDANDQTLPLGVPIEFESSLFIGKILIRLKSVPSSFEKDDSNHNTYFEGRKRHFQCIVQGRVKEEGLKFSDLFMGDIYNRPLKGLPPKSVMRWVEKFMMKINPAMQFQLSLDRPRILVPIGTVQEMSVDIPGEESDIMVRDGMEENTKLLVGENLDGQPTSADFTSAAQRRKTMSKPEQSSKYSLETDKVYTFHVYDQTIDFGSYEQDYGMVKVDLSSHLDGQPLAINALTLDERYMYRFEIWHEKILNDDDVQVS